MLWTQSATLDGDIGVLQNEIEARMRSKFPKWLGKGAFGFYDCSILDPVRWPVSNLFVSLEVFLAIIWTII